MRTPRQTSMSARAGSRRIFDWGASIKKLEQLVAVLASLTES